MEKTYNNSSDSLVLGRWPQTKIGIPIMALLQITFFVNSEAIPLSIIAL